MNTHPLHPWHEGEGIIFDDNYLHDAANESDEVRVVLWLDMSRPMPSREHLQQTRAVVRGARCVGGEDPPQGRRHHLMAHARAGTLPILVALALVVALAIAQPATASEPRWAEAIGDHFRTLPPPAAAPERWLLAHVDVETTGLAPGWHEVIDIGVVITELDGTELDRLFLRIMPAHPERLDPGAAAVNGFSVARWQALGSISEAEAVAALRAFHARVAGDSAVLFTAYNSWFDIAFVDHLFRAQDATWRELWHYHVLDVPSMAWGLGYRDLFGGSLADTLGIAAETRDPLQHTGITGAAANVEKYRALLERLAAEPAAPIHE